MSHRPEEIKFEVGQSVETCWNSKFLIFGIESKHYMYFRGSPSTEIQFFFVERLARGFGY